MKRLFLYLIPCLLIAALFTRCKKEQTYSCDPKVDAWVKEHKAEVAKMNLKELLASNNVYQRAVFAASSPEKKYELWLEKLTAIQRLDWNEQELAHITLLKSYLSVELFEDPSHKAGMNAKLKAWKEAALNDLKWNIRTIASIAATLELPVNKNGDLSYKSQRIASSDATTMDTETPPDCKCNKDDDWCNGLAGANGPLRCNSSDQCKQLTSGCGFFWSEPCNGKCL